MTNEQKEIALRVARKDFPANEVLAVVDCIEQFLAALPKPEPSFRGYAALGTGQYLLNACPATETLPPELVISIATDAEKEGRTIGDLRDVEPGTEINPDVMAVRLAFFSVAGLDALEQQLRILREESFPDTAPPDQSARIAELERENEGLRKDAEKWRAHEAKKAELINRGFLRSPLRDDAALAAKEKS